VLARIGVAGVPVKTSAELNQVDGLIIPGGESTVISKLAKIFGIFEPIKQAIATGLPVFGTCAGLIMLADEILDSASGQESFGGLAVTVRRNAFGHQVDSFEADLTFDSLPNTVHAAFIRAPIVEQAAAEVEVLSRLEDGRIVAVRQNSVLGISFHPEVTGETAIHEYFVNLVRQRNR
jgi:5'-phosphate synthase pdxT subunit